MVFLHDIHMQIRNGRHGKHLQLHHTGFIKNASNLQALDQTL